MNDDELIRRIRQDYPYAWRPWMDRVFCGSCFRLRHTPWHWLLRRLKGHGQ